MNIRPHEPDVNHYNASTYDTNSTFAGQTKLGLSYDIVECLSIKDNTDIKLIEEWKSKQQR